ncbi:MAG TPA: hypothetical protein VFN05_10760 [Actinomycetes bacterium]|nr:hypothetical protein [Actinomycetes bacterium]
MPGADGMVDPEPEVPLTRMGYQLWPEALGTTIRVTQVRTPRLSATWLGQVARANRLA